MTQEIYKYNGVDILFREKEDVIQINATTMSRPFGSAKRAKNWLSSEYAKEYLRIVAKGRNLPLRKLVEVTKGGRNSGTWMQEDVALEFARWLSPSFGFWCNGKVKELLVKGTVSLSLQEREVIRKTTEEVRRLRYEAENNKQHIEFASLILSRGESISVNGLAALLHENGCSIGRNILYEFLRKNGYVCRRKGINYNIPTRRSLKTNILTYYYPPMLDNNRKPKPVTLVTPNGIKHFLACRDIIARFTKTAKSL